MVNVSRNYKQYIVPILKVVYENNTIHFDELVMRVAQYVELTEDEMNDLVKCGRQKKYINNITTARTYLIKQEMIQYSKQKIVTLTDKGYSFYKEYLLFLSKDEAIL